MGLGITIGAIPSTFPQFSAQTPMGVAIRNSGCRQTRVGLSPPTTAGFTARG